MHSHGTVDSTLSTQDVSRLFYLSTVESTKGSVLGSMVITDSQTTLLMRGPRTPQWEPAYVKVQCRKWRDEVENRVQTVYSQMQGDSGIDLPPQSRAAGVIAHAGFIREIARKYDLRWFSGRPDAKSLTLLTA